MAPGRAEDFTWAQAEDEGRVEGFARVPGRFEEAPCVIDGPGLALAALSRLTAPCHKAGAHEIRARIDLTTGTCHGVVAAARTGIEAAPRHSAAIQLAAQQAKAWARTGGRSATEAALGKGRRFLEAMPYPGNLDHHFVADPG